MSLTKGCDWPPSRLMCSTDVADGGHAAAERGSSLASPSQHRHGWRCLAPQVCADARLMIARKRFVFVRRSEPVFYLSSSSVFYLSS
eukprot:3895739-Pyramimonas_sp.AAC.2